ncbi:universal stress protein [Terriglobus sp. ADX1]|uniref:universal stress protein n=1 Tax=Terriglobus sp. ADX1 TaxID=2794063 RepID=UPI002FE50E8A
MLRSLNLVPGEMPAPITDTPIPPVRRIVVGYSPDETGANAFRYALALASCFGAKLIAVRSIQRPAWGIVDVSYEMLAEDFLQQEKEQMEAAADKAREGHSVECTYKVAFGGPVDLLLAAVQSENADLAVLGCHGTDGLEALLLGSVSRLVGLLCTCPVLVLPPECVHSAVTLETAKSLDAGPILFVSDVRYKDMRTAEYAKEIATHLSRDLIAMHVVPEAQGASPNSMVWEEEIAKEQLRILLGERPGEGKALIAVRHGEPSREILAEATRRHAALIVAGGGVHHGGIDHVPWETLTRILRHATSPILVVPSNSK